MRSILGLSRSSRERGAPIEVCLDEAGPHRAAPEGGAGREDEEVIDETPPASKDIVVAMSVQRALVEVVHTLDQVVCVPG